MRYALLLILVGCASGPRPEPSLADDTLTQLPVTTFRWALNPLACDERDRRSSVDTCAAEDGVAEYLIAAYAPLSENEPRVAVIRYDGPHIGAPLRWQQHVDLGAAPHSAVATIVRNTAIVAAISDGECRLVAIDAATGRVLGTQTIAGAARAVQLEGVNDYARVHVRTRDGGFVAIVNPRTVRVIASRAVGETAIPMQEIVAVTPTAEQLEDVEIAWENQRLVVRRGRAWRQILRLAANETEVALHRASLVLADKRVLVTLHDPEEARIEVVAFDRDSGAKLWTSRLTGGSRRSFDNGLVRTELEPDQLVVYNSSNDFACTVGLADGIERACVDRRVTDVSQTVFDFPDDEIVSP